LRDVCLFDLIRVRSRARGSRGLFSKRHEKKRIEKNSRKKKKRRKSPQEMKVKKKKKKKKKRERRVRNSTGCRQRNKTPRCLVFFFTFFFFLQFGNAQRGYTPLYVYPNSKNKFFFFPHIYFKERKNTFKYYKNDVEFFLFFVWARNF
jgi:hypothetical protein